MRVTLDKENEFLTNDGKVNLKEAFIYSGIKAAWCYKKGTATPESIRAMSEEELLRIGTNTWVDDHGTPDEHYNVKVEITGIPKLLCMILNNEKQYTADERSLRYTKVLKSEYITDIEVELYNKWLQIFVNIFKSKYQDFFMKVNEGNEEKALDNMKKIAQENARGFVSVLTPTSIAYTAPWYQWQKLATFLTDMINNPVNELEKLASPYAKDLINQLIDLKVVVMTKDVIQLYPKLEETLKKKNDNREWLYKNNKMIKLSLFAENNPFSGIDKPNKFETAINYNSQLSISAVAQGQRHRTSDFEIRVPKIFNCFIPEFIKGTSYEIEYLKDIQKVVSLYPQSQMLDVNVVSSIKKIIDYMGKERACDRAQQEIENWYVNQFIPDIVEGLSKVPEYDDQYKLLKTKYMNRCRCAYPNYNCPNPCGHPRTKRPF